MKKKTVASLQASPPALRALVSPPFRPLQTPATQATDNVAARVAWMSS